MSPVPTPSPRSPRWQRFAAASVRGFHAYANWLVGVSWKRFFVLALLLLIAAGILQDVPPLTWSYTETVHTPPKKTVLRDGSAAKTTTPPTPPAPGTRDEPRIKIEKSRDGKGDEAIDISIDARGIRVTPRRAAAASSAASAADADEPVVDIRLPPGTTSDTVREAVAEARQAIQDAVREARQEAREAAAESAAQSAEKVADKDAEGGIERHTRTLRLGDGLPELAVLWILASAIIKITYKKQIQAEAQAAQAVETAEAESLKRQVVEARMAAMQAQVEPHFLFNTLASIDHLIEVDPQRASQMQKNLIALLRASMPTMREASGQGGNGLRELGRELAVIRPYLEILKVRMEERLATEVDVPEGLGSAEFPPMMLQTLVENAIKHGLEPKPEGGRLKVKAEVLHGKLAVSVADTGLGFGRAATAGTGVGLANIRERLQLLYGSKAALTVTENPGGGTVATITVPYKPVEGANA